MSNVIRSFEIKDDAKVGPTCIVTLVRGTMLHFRLCQGQIKKVASTGSVPRDDFLTACSIAAHELRNAKKEQQFQEAKTRVSEFNPNRKLWYQD